MFPCTLQYVSNQPERRLQVENSTSVTNRIAQSLVAIVRCYKEVKVLAGHPAIYIRGGHTIPLEWASRCGLVRAVDLHCVMSGRSAKPVSLGNRIDVSEGTGVDKQHLSADRQLHTQRISMTVSYPAGLLRPDINDKLRLHRFHVRHHVNPARFQTKRTRSLLRRRQLLESAYTLGSHEPHSFFSNATSRRFKVRAVEQRRTRCEGIQQVHEPIAPRIK